MLSNAKTYTVAGAARELGFGLAYTYSLIYTGRLDASKVDGKWAVSKDAIEAILSKRAGAQ